MTIVSSSRVLFSVASVIVSATLAQRSSANPPLQSGKPSVSQEGFDLANDGVVIVQAMVNGHPARALIDTGFPDNAIDAEYADKIGISPTNFSNALSVGGVTKFGNVGRVDIKIGNYPVASNVTSYTNLSYIKKKLGISFDVVIGASAIMRSKISINFDDNMIRLGSGSIPPTVSLILPFRYDPVTHRMTVETAIGSSEISRTLIDTGDIGEFEIDSDQFKKLSSKISHVTDNLSYGAGGSIVEPVFSSSVQIGSLNIPDVLVDVENYDGFLKSAEVNGLLGLGLLSRYNITIDGLSNKLIFTPRKNPPAKIPRSSVGLQMEYGQSSIKVVHVMKNSPASMAGIKIGDIICSVNGNKVVNGWINSPLRHWGTARQGTHYNIGLCTGKDVSLTAAYFY